MSDSAPAAESAASTDQVASTSPAIRSPKGASRQATPVTVERSTLIRGTITVLLVFTGWLLASRVVETLTNFLFLILLAWLVAIAMEPAVQWLSARGMRRGMSTGAVMGGLFLLLVAIVAVFGGAFVAQSADLLRSLPETIAASTGWVNRTFRLDIDPTELLADLQLTSDQIGPLLTGLAGGLVGVLSFVGSAVGAVFNALTVAVFAFYMSADGPRLRRTIGSWLPQPSQEVFVHVWDTATIKTGGFVVSKLVLAALSSIAHSAFFWFIDLPYWLPMGVFAGIVSQFIPTVGTYIGVAVPMLFAVVDQPLNALWIAIFATIYQQIENYIFTPRISRVTMDIHPAVALGAVFVFALLFGPIGALIGIPLAAAILTLFDTYRNRYALIPSLAEAKTAQ
jgi:predicted PurR-regulated permease PerM